MRILSAPTPTLKGGFTLKRLLEDRDEEPPSHSLADAFSEPGQDSSTNPRLFKDIVTGGVVALEDVAPLFNLCVSFLFVL